MILNTECTELNHCIVCNSLNLTEILNLNTQPLANSFKKIKDETQKEYPLKLNKCNNCHHLQLSHMVHPDELFKNYIYVSGTSKTQLNYFNWFSELVKNKTKLNSKILDIGCNDGSQLNYFKSLGFDTYGIDPAENLYPISSKNHKITCNYFNKINFDDKFDAIICQNAFAHNYDQLNFLQKCKDILNNDGLIFITISQATMIKNNEFDTIYHEHYSYYNINSMKILCERTELNLIDVVMHPIHGNTYIFIISKNKNLINHKVLEHFQEEEKELGLYDMQIYNKYSKNALNISKQFKEKIEDLKQKGYTLIGYGSPAKGNTLLNFSKVTLDFIIDDNPLKQNMFTPGSSIPIYSIHKLDDIKSSDKVCFIPLAWNFFDEIKEKINSKRKNNLYLKYFPKVELTS